MKVLELIGGTLILTSVFSACATQSPVTMLCSIDWFVVTVHPFLLNNDVYVHFHELHLGLGCPANHIEPHAYRFAYPITECGIRAKAVSLDVVIYSSELHYASKGTSSKYVIPVSCTAPQQSPWLPPPCPMRVASGTVTGEASYDEASYDVFTLSQSTQRPNCDCPPCVFNEEECIQTPRRPVEAQGRRLLQPSAFVDLSEDWSLRSDDLIGSM